MDATKKKTRKRIVFAIILLLVAGGLVALPFLLDKQQTEGSKASLLSVQAERGTIRKKLSGTGTLTEQEAQAVSVPQGVKVTEYLVENGQFVTAGEAVARVDKVSVMETISTVREAMTETAKEIESARSKSGSTAISAPAAAKVKAVYASKGDSVQEVMLEHGALAVLSLDGMMSVSFPCDEALSIGDGVIVRLSDAGEVAGRVESAYDGNVTVTISDAYGSVGEAVQVLDRDGQALGSGSLSVHSAWKAMGTDGTVSQVSISEGKAVYSGSALFTITADEGGGYAELIAEYRAYEEVMEQLFRLYTEGAATAPCDGCVSGVDKSILELLSASGRGTIMLLANAPGDDPDGEFANCVGMVTAVNEDGTVTMKMQAWNTEIPDYTDLSYVFTAADSMTVEATFAPPTVFVWDGTAWSVGGGVNVGDVFVVAYGGAPVWMIRVGHNELPEPAQEPTPEPSPQPETPGTPGQGGVTPQMPTGGGGAGGFGGAAGAKSQEAEKTRYDTAGATILSVTPQETVTVPITVDELDILSVHAGQDVQVTLDALPGQAFSGVITEVSKTASNEGGNSKYSAVVQLERTGMMLGGMNASASIVVEERESVLLIPSAAIVEIEGQTMVYTACDPQTQTLGAPVAVELGLSDGEMAEILSGLAEGDAVWYAYYDKLEVKGLS